MGEIIKKYKKEIIVAVGIIGFAICIVIVSSISSKKEKYNEAVNLIEQGKYDEGFSLMSEVKDVGEVNEYKYSKAKEAYDQKDYSVAIKLFDDLNGYKDSSSMIALCSEGEKERLYKQCEEQYRSMSYELAMEGFISLGDYKSSSEYVQKCKDGINDEKLSVAKNYIENENYDLALKTLVELNGYKDSEELINEINTIYEQKYNEAISYYNKNSFQEALTCFEALPGFKDSDANVLKCKLKLINVGAVFNFGHFEQDNNTGNGKEIINWIVLKKEANKVLLLSEKVLDSQKFFQYNQGVTWEKSDLRAWLNGSFYNSAFSDDEKKIIFKSYLTDTRYSIWNVEPGPATFDYVFCLSNNEIETNLTDYSKWRGTPTAYAVAQGCKTDIDGMATAWWLRTPGWDKTSVCAVKSSDSSIDSVGYYVYREYVGVRPAIWIDIRIFS